MRPRNSCVLGLVTLSGSLLINCGGHDAGSSSHTKSPTENDPKVLNIFAFGSDWAPSTVPDFEKRTGIKVHVANYDNNETLESRLLAGSSGFDVVIPTASYFQRQIRAGVYLPLNKKLLTNLPNLDPAIMSSVSVNDADNAHGVVYERGTFGIGYNVQLLAKSLPGVRVNSWKLLFDPSYAAKLSTCGITILDTAAGVVRLALLYLGRDPNVPSSHDLADVEAMLENIRPYVRNIDSSLYRDSLANGDVCISIGYNGDVVQAKNRARETNSGVQIAYVIPDEGSLLWFEMLAIPRDAPHPSNAHLFINYMLEPHISANNSNFTGFANANVAATQLVDPSIASDPAIYPPSDQLKRLVVPTEDPPEQSRAMTRLWQKFKTGN